MPGWGAICGKIPWRSLDPGVNLINTNYFQAPCFAFWSVTEKVEERITNSHSLLNWLWTQCWRVGTGLLVRGRGTGVWLVRYLCSWVFGGTVCLGWAMETPCAWVFMPRKLSSEGHWCSWSWTHSAALLGCCVLHTTRSPCGTQFTLDIVWNVVRTDIQPWAFSLPGAMNLFGYFPACQT